MSEDRKNLRPAEHLSGFKGVLQVDGYNGFKRLAGDRSDQSTKVHELHTLLPWNWTASPEFVVTALAA